MFCLYICTCKIIGKVFRSGIVNRTVTKVLLISIVPSSILFISFIALGCSSIIDWALCCMVGLKLKLGNRKWEMGTILLKDDPFEIFEQIAEE